MRTYVAAFVVACLAAALLTPPTRRLALRWGAVSRPGGRNVHGSVVPRLGGVAIFLALLLPLAGLFVVDSSVAAIVRLQALKAVGLLVGATAMVLVGVVDDSRGLPATVKLIAQLAVAALAFACGFRIDAISVPLLGVLPMGVFAFPMTLLWITGIINAVNLIDGLDGLAAGIVLFAGLTNLAIACMDGAVFIAVISAAMTGAVLGFLVFNFNPARIFMGDSGSYLLGYVLGTSAIVGSQKASTAVALLVPCLAMGVPIFDTLFSMVRRYLERRPIFSPDRGHIHHRLLDMGLTHRRAVLTIYAASAVFSVAAIATSFGQAWQVGVALLAASAVFFSLVRAAGYFEYLHHHLRLRGRIQAPRTTAIRRALPELAERLGAASDEAQVREALDELQRNLAFERVGLVERAATSQPPSRSRVWRGRETEIFQASFPVGSEELARCDVTFAWSAGEGAATPAMEVLLELAADLVERALVRVESPLGPLEAPAARPSQVTSPIRRAAVAVGPSTLGSSR
jgi:UDP-GlcNAc:undecaprenyl-phosphate GlcNAc-1-phosphate transferase